MASRFPSPLLPDVEVTKSLLFQVFTPKDKLADWFEHYADVLELNVWTSTNLKTSSWDDSSRQWTVVLDRQQGDKHEERERCPPAATAFVRLMLYQALSIHGTSSSPPAIPASHTCQPTSAVSRTSKATA